jgi:DNA recombination protein RmuC
MNVLIALVTLAAGLAVGWLAAARRADASSRHADAATQAALTEAARLQAVLDAERASAAERAENAHRTEVQLRETFGSLAAEALARNSAALQAQADSKLTHARAVADGDLEKRQQAIETMVEPLRESLNLVQRQLAESERLRGEADAALRENLLGMRTSSEQLRTETAQLVTTLRAPQVRGRWGELQLERTVEAAGMTEHVDYVTQESVSGEDGRVRPDLVVKLVGGKNVVVDSKVAFAGYLEAMEAKDDVTRAARLKAHARHLRDHIDQLSAKAYWQRFDPTPEFVVCFVPADAFLDAALREDPSLMERAFERNIVLATPSTLIALLRTVAYTWRQEALAANAAEVHKLGRDLYTRLSTMGGHIDKLGRALGSAVGSYNNAVSSLESRVFVSARKMSDLGVVEPGAELKVPDQVTESPRTTQAPEYADQRVVSLTKQRVIPGQAELTTGEAVGN